MGRILYIIAVILVIAWAITFFGGMVDNGWIHAILVVAVIVVIINLIGSGGRRV